jgi:hypothetical protein
MARTLAPACDQGNHPRCCLVGPVGPLLPYDSTWKTSVPLSPALVL